MTLTIRKPCFALCKTTVLIHPGCRRRFPPNLNPATIADNVGDNVGDADGEVEGVDVGQHLELRLIAT